MKDLQNDLVYFFGFLVLLFIGWVITGGPQRSRDTGDAYNKFQKPLAPLDSGVTYDQSIKDSIDGFIPEVTQPSSSSSY